MHETPRPRTGVDPVETAPGRGRWPECPSRKHRPDGVEHPDDALFLAWSIRNWMASAAPAPRASLQRQFARIILLVLAGRSHAVIAKADGERRSFSSDLKCAVAALDQIGNEIVRPGIGQVRWP